MGLETQTKPFSSAPAGVPATMERYLVKIVRELAAEQQLKLALFSHDWIIRLERGPRIRYIHGYNFELNSATAQLLANDKNAVSELMGFKEIPHVEHKLFLHPRLAGYVTGRGSWAEMMAFAESHNFQVVCKPNNGTGGEDVFRVRSQTDMERIVQQLFQLHRAICLSPFYQIDEEYRVIFLEGNCELIYAKDRPAVVGDGHATIVELIAEQVNQGLLPVAVAERALRLNQARLNEVLAEGEHFILDWKHNLARGSHPILVDNPQLQAALGALAQQCAAELNISFASVDIIETGGELLILEVNAGVMMEHFAQSAPDGYARAKAIYAKAVELMFR